MQPTRGFFPAEVDSRHRHGLPAGLANRRRAGLALVIVVVLVGGLANAEVRLPKILGSNMVVQRDHPICVWGESNPGARIQVSLGDQQTRGQAGTNGQWQVVLQPVAAGGPYALTVMGDGSSLELTNVLCGDVWLCSGQSNMQLPVKDVAPDEQKTVLVQHPTLRLCSVAKTPSPKPLSSADIRWHTYTPESARDFSAVACFFAHALLADPALAKIPIGLVDSSFGGTTCEGWIPQPALARFAAKDLHDSMFGIKPANLYNGMIAPLGHTAFKGVVWYQGESNAAHPEIYPALLATMVSEWRQQFGEPALPFLVVQLPEYANLWEGFYWPWIRETQAEAAHSISNAALVVGIRTTDGFNLHPKEKLEIGRRAALAARKLAYGEAVVASGPVFNQASTEGSTIRVSFDTGGNGLASASPGEVEGFAVAGADGDYRFAHANIDGDTVVVATPDIAQPKTVRYAWSAIPRATLVDQSGLPAAPFRTDKSPPSNVELQEQRVTRRVATATYELVIDPNGMASSLVFHGAQFLSNEPGVSGGSSIPGFWGPRTLTTIRELGPQLLSCSDEEVTLKMAFEEKAMRWSITNGGKDPLIFQLALSPHVKVSGPVNDKWTLNRGAATLNLEGFDTVTNTPTGAVLISNLKPGAAKLISLH